MTKMARKHCPNTTFLAIKKIALNCNFLDASGSDSRVGQLDPNFVFTSFKILNKRRTFLTIKTYDGIPSLKITLNS